MRYASIKETAKLYASIYTEAGLRNLVQQASNNGFKQCIRRIKKKVIINLDEFEKWIEEHKAIDPKKRR